MGPTPKRARSMRFTARPGRYARPPWRSPSRSSSWPRARARACGRRCPRCFTRSAGAHARLGHRGGARRRRRPRGVRSRGPATGSTRRCPRARGAEQTEGEGTGSAVLAARDQVEPRAPSSSSPATTRSITAALIAELVAEHPRTERRRDAAHDRGARPHRVRPHRPRRRRRRRADRRDQAHRGRAAEELAIREINIGTYAFDGARAVRRARRGRATTRRALPHRRLPAASRSGGRDRRAHHRRPRARWASTTART